MILRIDKLKLIEKKHPVDDLSESNLFSLILNKSTSDRTKTKGKLFFILKEGGLEPKLLRRLSDRPDSFSPNFSIKLERGFLFVSFFPTLISVLFVLISLLLMLVHFFYLRMSLFQVFSGPLILSVLFLMMATYGFFAGVHKIQIEIGKILMRN